MSYYLATQPHQLLLQSQIKKDISDSDAPLIRTINKSQTQHFKRTNELIHDFPHSKYMIINNTKQQQEQKQYIKYTKDQLKTLRYRRTSTQPHKNSQVEVKQLEEEKDLLQRNYTHEVEYYVRERMKDLLRIHQLLLSNQIELVQQYVQTQLNQLRKMHEFYFSVETCCQYNYFSGIIDKNNIELDINYTQLIDNLIGNMQQFYMGNNCFIPLLQRLESQEILSIHKLAWYLQQMPLDVGSYEASRNLAIRLVSQFGCTSGDKVVDVISRSVQERSKGKYRIYRQKIQFKSQMSKLIQEFQKRQIRDYHFQEICY